jgi:hypothetical protein
MDFTRRTMLLAGLAVVSVAGGTAAPAGAFTAYNRELPPPPLDGELRFDAAARAAAAADFGHLVHRTPMGVLLPGSDQDVATTIRWAGRLGRQVAPQGQSHSVYGRAQVRAGIVLDMTRLRTIHPLQDDRVVVDAGATWREVLAATLTLAVLQPIAGRLAKLIGRGVSVAERAHASQGALCASRARELNTHELDTVSGATQEGEISRGHKRERIRLWPFD